MMKLFLPFVCFLCSHAQGQVFADFETTLGDFSVELDYVNSPQTVANFIVLAEGSRPWVDSATGEVRVATPYYDGITFHRVIDGFVIQAGSQNGLGTDGPGYVFPDETDNGLAFDAPQLLAMANSGPNSNGSQFFLTEGTPTNLNGIHTIFGSVSAGGDVVNNIHATPVDADGIANTGDDTVPTTDVLIDSVTIRRVGDAAQDFDEFGEEIPVVSAVSEVNLEFSNDNRALLAEGISGVTFDIDTSTDLLSWSTRSHFIDSTQVSTPVGDLNREFFQTNGPVTLVTWPLSAPGPASYFGKTLTFTLGSTVIVVAVNALGEISDGTITIDGQEDPITEFREESTNAYGASLVVFSNAFVPFRFRLGADSPDGGRMTGTAFTDFPQSISGLYTLTTP